MESARSLRSRAMLALLLMVGFYAFALAIAGALLWVPYAEVTYMDRINGRLTLFCVIGGLTILYAIVPRIDKFEAPGPRLTPANAPKLFEMINDVAKQTSQPRPEDVFLLGDVNAFVSQRGGVMGFGSKRVMGIGLPLIKGLTPNELRSVIAHEFGHYVSGDVALGPWIHKTRSAIGRTLQHLGGNWILAHVFAWYARMFMRMTMQISREQEFVADATAAKVAGTATAISALKRVELIAPAFSTYMDQEVMPVIRQGFLPPITDGFEQYLGDPDTHRMFASYAKDVALGAEAGEFDTHPKTVDRIKALARGNEPAHDTSSTPVALLKDPDRHAKALLEHNFGRDNVVKLKAINWAEVGPKVYGQIWTSQAKEHAKWLGKLTADQVPSDKKWFLAKGKELAAKDFPDAPPEYHIGFLMHVLICGIGTALLARGWAIETAPGRPIELVKDGARFNLRESLNRLAEEKMSADEWKAMCDSLGINDLPLASQT